MVRSTPYSFAGPSSVIRYSVDEDSATPDTRPLLSDRDTEITVSFRTHAMEKEAVLVSVTDANDPGFIRLYVSPVCWTHPAVRL